MTTPARVKQAEVTRVVRGAVNGGMQIGTVVVSPTGQIVLYAKGEDQAPRPNPLDDLLLNGR